MSENLCPPCGQSMHDHCVRRADVDNPPHPDGKEWTCGCDCDPTADAPSAALAVVASWPGRESRLALAFDRAAGEMALAPPTSQSERAEVGDSIARFMLAARDGASATQVVRTVVAQLGPAEALNAAETLANWALALAAEAERKGGK